MTIGEKIKFYRNKLNLTQEDLAIAANTKKQTIHKYETGIITNIPASKIKAIADKLETTPAFLMGWSEEKHISVGTPYNPTVHKIPVLGYISAGLPIYADEHIIDYTYTDLNGGAEYFALKVKGDSMNGAQINDGNTVIVRVQPTVENGEIAVVRVNGDDATVKRFRKDGDDVQLIPQSYNPDHQIQFYNLKETTVEVIGKVVECKITF